MTDEAIPWRHLTADGRRRLHEAVRAVGGEASWVRLIYLFGSAVRGDKPARDVDVGVLASPAPGWAAPGRLAADIAERSGIVDLSIDVRLLGGASPVFLHEVLRAGPCVYAASEEERIAFEVQATSAWLDFKPVYERMRGASMKRWAGG